MSGQEWANGLMPDQPRWVRELVAEEIDRREQQNTELREALDHISWATCCGYAAKVTRQALAGQPITPNPDREDAERYRHIRTSTSHGDIDLCVCRVDWTEEGADMFIILTDDRADSEIDAARAGEF